MLVEHQHQQEQEQRQDLQQLQQLQQQLLQLWRRGAQLPDLPLQTPQAAAPHLGSTALQPLTPLALPAYPTAQQVLPPEAEQQGQRRQQGPAAAPPELQQLLLRLLHSYR